jgi:hypothetical protein
MSTILLKITGSKTTKPKEKNMIYTINQRRIMINIVKKMERINTTTQLMTMKRLRKKIMLIIVIKTIKMRSSKKYLTLKKPNLQLHLNKLKRKENPLAMLMTRIKIPSKKKETLQRNNRRRTQRSLSQVNLKDYRSH